jgi:low temperature requirement protein LtrA
MDAQPTEREQRVTPLELLFDLVVVFAITQVTLRHDCPEEILTVVVERLPRARVRSC